MGHSDQELFGNRLTTPQTPLLGTGKKFHRPLSTLSIYCRENGPARIPRYSSKTSHLPRNGPLDVINNSSLTYQLPSRTQAELQSSVVGSSITGHMTDINLTGPPTIAPSTPPLSNTKFSGEYKDGADYCQAITTPSTPPLSPSTSISTITSPSLSEPRTPSPNGSIDPHRFSTSSQSITSSTRNKHNDFGPLVTSLLDWKKAGDETQTPSSPTPKASAVRTKNRNTLSVAAKKNKKTVPTTRRRKVPNFIPEPGPFIPEGLHLIQYPAADKETTIIPDILEAGHIIGYGSCPVPATRLELSRQRCQIWRNKARHYGIDGRVKNVRSSGSISGESETSEETESEKRSGVKRRGSGDCEEGEGAGDVFVDALTKVEVVELSVVSA